MISLKTIYWTFLNEATTKSGQEIEIDVEEQSTDKLDVMNNGWVIHKFLVKIGGKEVGYLKVSYIPKSNFDALYDIVFFVNHIEGSGGRKENWKELPIIQRIKHLDMTKGRWPFDYNGLDKSWESLPEQELAKIEQDLLKELKENKSKQYNEFIDYHVDKPLVDYIIIDPKQRRKGIGVFLYEYAAKWLKKHKGLKLYASGIQTKEAKSAWDWLRQNKKANIGTEKALNGKVRTFLTF